MQKGLFHDHDTAETLKQTNISNETVSLPVKGSFQGEDVSLWLTKNFISSAFDGITTGAFIMARARDTAVLNHVYRAFIELFLQLQSESSTPALIFEAGVNEYISKVGAQMNSLHHVVLGLCKAFFSLLVTSNYAKAVEELMTVLQTEKKNSMPAMISTNVRVLALHGLGRAYEGMSEPQKAVEMYNSVIQLCPSFVWSHCERAYVNFANDALEEALKDYNKAVELMPNDYQTYFCRAMLYEKMNRLEGALTDYSKCTECNPKFEQSYYAKASLLLQMGRVEEAHLVYHKVVESNPESSAAYFNRAVFYDEKLQRPVDAFQDYCKTIDLDPQCLQAYRNRGQIYYSVFLNHEQASMDFQRASRLSE